MFSEVVENILGTISAKDIENALEIAVIFGLPLSLLYIGKLIRDDVQARHEANTHKFPACDHSTLTFGSGDYYVMCQECSRKWVLSCGPREYGEDINGEHIGGTPEYAQGRSFTCRVDPQK